MHRLWYDLRTQSMFEEQLREAVLEHLTGTGTALAYLRERAMTLLPSLISA